MGAISELNLPKLSHEEAILRFSVKLFEDILGERPRSSDLAEIRRAISFLYAPPSRPLAPILYKIDDCVEMIEKYPDEVDRWLQETARLAKSFVNQVNAIKFGCLTSEVATQLRP